jgi:hypothetical protein
MKCRRVALVGNLVVSSILFLGSAHAQPVGAPTAVYNQGLASAVVVPADAVPFSRGPTRALYINTGSACNISMQLQQDTTNVTWPIAVGVTILSVSAKFINATGTTCAGGTVIGIW